MKSPCTAISALLALTVASHALAAEPAAGALPRARLLPSALAVEIAQRAVAACAAKGWPVSVAIADSTGTVRTLVTVDGVRALTIETARRKARTAALQNIRTSELAKAVTAAPRYEQVLSSLDPTLIFLGGGVPIVVAGELIGAVGVGGAPRGAGDAENDEDCARAALDAVSERLK